MTSFNKIAARNQSVCLVLDNRSKTGHAYFLHLFLPSNMYLTPWNVVLAINWLKVNSEDLLRSSWCWFVAMKCTFFWPWPWSFSGHANSTKVLFNFTLCSIQCLGQKQLQWHNPQSWCFVHTKNVSFQSEILCRKLWKSILQHMHKWWLINYWSKPLNTFTNQWSQSLSILKSNGWEIYNTLWIKHRGKSIHCK